MDIQWYPGHMTKAKRQMQEDIKLVDLVIELLDARAPLASRNPDIDSLAANKARLIILNKADLADESGNREWKDYFEARSSGVILADSRKASTLKKIQSLAQEVCREKLERDARRGIKNRPIRAMVAGIPNVGKSTFINSYAGKAVAKTGNRPGVTKGRQWIRMGKNLELLDTPGILWPKFEDQRVGRILSWIGTINDNILNIQDLSADLIDYLKQEYPGVLSARYQIEEDVTAPAILFEVGKKRGCVTKGGERSFEKAAALVIDDFRSGKLGRITLEKADQQDQ